jgi:MFS transporter, DHA1 family, multidrug resistance protein
LAGLGLGQLIIGQLPDAVGRRRPLLLGLGWHAVMSVLCALAPTITVPAATCTLQGVSRVPPCGAMCRGCRRAVPWPPCARCSAERAAQLLSRLFLVLRIAPILLPLLDGALHGRSARAYHHCGRRTGRHLACDRRKALRMV